MPVSLTPPAAGQTALLTALVFWRPTLLLAALGTVVIETPLFWLLGYRRWRECLGFAGINIVSNLLLNESLSALPPTAHIPAAIAVGELLVLALEFTLCRRMVRGSSARLLKVLTITNATSLLCGLVLFALL